MTHAEALEYYINHQYNVSIAQVMAMCSNSNESESFWRLAMKYRRNLPSGVRLV